MTRLLTREVEIGSRWRFQLEFKSADAWVGAYWVNHGGFWDLWVCLLPFLPLHFYSIER